MAVNENVWGQKSDWKVSSIVGATMTVDDKYKIYQGNFGQTEQTYYKAGSLFKGLQSGKLTIDAPIDNSMAYCALGAESPMSTIRYFDTTAQTIVATDNRSKTDFCFATSLNVAITNNPIVIRQYLGASTSSSEWTTDRHSRWSPYAKNPSSPTDTSYENRYIEPIIQFSPKNFVLLIYVTVCADLNNTADSHEYTLNEYLDTYTTTYPYITSVDLRVCFANTDITNRSSTSLNANAPTIVVFNELSVGNLMHNSDGNSLKGLLDYDICCGNGQAFHLMGVGKTASIGFPSNGVITKNTSTTVNYYTPIFGSEFVKHIISETQTRWYMPYSEDNIEKIRRATACFGLFFSGDITTAKTGDYTDPEMYMGVLEKNVGNGDYTKGAYNTRNDQFDWDTTADSKYIPGGGGGDSETKLHRRSDFGDTSGTWYALPNNGLAPFKTIMQKINDVDEIEDKNFYGQNPVDCIIEAKELYLANLSELWVESIGISFGDYAIPISGEITLTGTMQAGFTFPSSYLCGDITIQGKYGDYRDHEPYTSAVLVVPFCGMVELEPSVIIGNHMLRLEEVIDEFSGDIVANLLVDNCLYRTLTGNCASDISISGVEASTYALARKEYLRKATFEIFDGLEGLIGGISGASIASSYKNKMGTVSQAFGGLMNFTKDLVGGIMDIRTYQHLHPSPVRLSTGSPNPQSNAITYPYIFVQYPIDMLSETETETFKKLNGFAVYKTGKLSDSSGMTVCSDYNFDGLSLTKAELDMLAELLEGGVIV